MKTIKRLLYSSLSLGILLILSGCVKLVDGKPTGLIWDFIGQYISKFITFFATEQGLGFGIAIMLVTLLVRLLILPLGLYQSWNATYQSEKRNYLKPYLDPFHQRLQAAQTQEEKLAAQQALMAAQKEYGVSIFGGMGCAPLVIQMPFFFALYAAVQYTAGISSSHFMGIPLGKPSLLLTVLVGIFYLGQSALTLVGVDAEQKEQMKKMVYVSPISIMVFSYVSPASITLYWVVGGLASVIQQLITIFIIRPTLRKRVAEEYAQNPPKASSVRVKDITPTSSSAIQEPVRHKKQNRNAGKQHR